MNEREARDELVAQAGRLWADAVLLDLRNEGRRAAGGWPGTMSEARARMANALSATIQMPPDERQRLCRLLYESAKRSWQVHREPEAQDE